MRRSRLIVLLGVLCLVLVLVAACAKPTPTPTPTPKPTPSPSPTAKPSPTAPAHEPFAVAVYGNPFGSSSYIAGFVTADVINKNSTWLRANAIETAGTIYNLTLFQREPRLRANSVQIQSVEGWYGGKMGLEPYTKYDGDIRALYLTITPFSGFAARDPNIKTGKDLAGKKVGMATVGSNATLPGEILMKNIWQVWDKVKPEYLGFDGSPRALKDGTVDAAVFTGGFAAGKFNPTPGFLELASSTVDFHYLDIPNEDWAAARQKTGWPIYGEVFQPGTLTAQQKTPAGGWWLRLGIWADKALPDDVAYEIVRVVYEHPEPFGQAHAMMKDLSQKTLALAAPNESYFHPGAVKFYKEKGVKIGFE